ncbi:D-alanyl-D-alanine carboxypeptidase [Rickettsiales bacterium]|nr:D-alanyl-D-alanine carboxypeptidase [Rickettsiales bacterium]
MFLRLFLLIILLSSTTTIRADTIKVKDPILQCNDTHTSLVFSENIDLNISENEASKKIFPASLVKIMTAYLVFEAIEEGKLSFDQKIKISARSNATSYVNRVTTLHLKIGDEITIKDALYGMIIKSFNGAAVALAEKIAGSEWEFAQMMNKKAIKIGMYDSNFRNASGLHDKGQYTTAYDLKKLILSIKNKYPQYYKIFGMKEIEIFDKKFTSHNNVLLNYKGAEGMKTGFTSLSGFNLISSAYKNDHRVFSILLSCESSNMRNNVTKKMLDEAFFKIANDIK